MRKQPGFTLLEIAVVVAIIGIVALVAVPAFGTYRRKASVRAAAYETMSMLREARSRAIESSRNVGIKFTQSGSDWMYALYEDGDGDGIRSDDIRNGTDRRVTPTKTLMPQLLVARIAVPSTTIHDPDGDTLTPSSDPVAFGRSSICTFSPLGTGTPGSIYLIDDIGEIYCVRIYGATGRAHFLHYDGRRWEER